MHRQYEYLKFKAQKLKSGGFWPDATTFPLLA
jgi:hypothetical protein